jgi:hypothetical protein
MLKETKAVTKMVRFNYVNIFELRAASPGEEAKYNIQLLIPKSDVETISKINAAVEAAKKQGASLWKETNPAALKLPLRDGDLEKSQQKEYAGHFFITAASKYKPGVVDKDRMEILEEAEVYSGCYGRVSLSFYPYDKEGSKGVGCGLLNVQKLAEGEPLGRSRAEEDFAEDYEEEDILW